jgi:hypothetical protein
MNARPKLMSCDLYMLLRIQKEYFDARDRGHLNIALAKQKSFEILRQHGFRDVFRASLTPDGQSFRNLEEHARFNFCVLA